MRRRIDANVSSPDRHERVHRDIAHALQQVDEDAVYIGRDWRIRVSGDDLVHERLIAGVWTVKDTIAGA